MWSNQSGECLELGEFRRPHTGGGRRGSGGFRRRSGRSIRVRRGIEQRQKLAQKGHSDRLLSLPLAGLHLDRIDAGQLQLVQHRGSGHRPPRIAGSEPGVAAIPGVQHLHGLFGYVIQTKPDRPERVGAAGACDGDSFAGRHERVVGSFVTDFRHVNRHARAGSDHDRDAQLPTGFSMAVDAMQVPAALQQLNGRFAHRRSGLQLPVAE